MSTFPLVWRNDRGIFERTCPHGIGHPDPDQFDYWMRSDRMYESVHGCCGVCCIPGDNMENCTVCGNPVEVIAQRGSGFCSQLCERSTEPGFESLAARFRDHTDSEVQ